MKRDEAEKRAEQVWHAYWISSATPRDFIPQLADALQQAALDAAPKWRPIAEAPRGPWIFVSIDRGYATSVKWIPGYKWEASNGDRYTDDEIWGWMPEPIALTQPLPAPPTEAK